MCISPCIYGDIYIPTALIQTSFEHLQFVCRVDLASGDRAVSRHRRCISALRELTR